jgi:hypothetical protein
MPIDICCVVALPYYIFQTVPLPFPLQPLHNGHITQQEYTSRFFPACLFPPTILSFQALLVFSKVKVARQVRAMPGRALRKFPFLAQVPGMRVSHGLEQGLGGWKWHQNSLCGSCVVLFPFVPSSSKFSPPSLGLRVETRERASWSRVTQQQ